MGNTKKKLKNKTKLKIVILVGISMFVALQVIIGYFNRTGMGEYDGIIVACQFGICIYMVWYNYKAGWVSSIFCLLFSLANMLMALVHGGQQTILSGVANTVFYILTISLLSLQFRSRDKDAITDFLTGLSNRRGLYKKLQDKIENETPFYLIYIDLGNFKLINDTYGHFAGDSILKVVSERMMDYVGKQGEVTRIGGDEFIILLDETLDPRAAAEELLNRISERIFISTDDNQFECYLNGFAGIAAFPDDSKEVESLIKYADIAMYHAVDAKEENNKICFFNEDMEKALSRQLEVENLIKEGLENDYFYPVYQPQFTMDDKILRGFEALLRMKTASGEIISPGEFIPIAEKTDLILKIDDFVIRKVLTQFKDIVLYHNPELTISVNVSAKNIDNDYFVDKLGSILEETEFPANNLEIEITEYCLLKSVDATLFNISALHRLGVQIALDDFGTGYSSLSYVSNMPIDLLKIDKSIIDSINYDKKHKDFVNAIINMGHIMECEVISEGVELEEQLELLREQGCDFVQGYVWGKPVEFETARLMASNDIN